LAQDSVATNPSKTADSARASAGAWWLTVGLGWQVRQTTGADYDLDASAIVVDPAGRVLADNYFVFFNNLVSPDGAVRHNRRQVRRRLTQRDITALGQRHRHARPAPLTHRDRLILARPAELLVVPVVVVVVSRVLRPLIETTAHRVGLQPP